MNDWVKLHERDHVAVALRPMARGEAIEPGEGQGPVTLLDDVPAGHKIALRPIAQGEDVLKFGYSIGRAKQDVQPGSWVHTHNLGTGLKGFLDYRYEPAAGPAADSPAAPAGGDRAGSAGAARTFNGYLRASGEAGIRNEIWIINTVGCINKTCELLARRGDAMFGGRVDGVYHFAHPFGCSQLGDDLTHTQRLLAALVNHPNAGGVLVVGLGCENNRIESFKQAIGPYDPQRVKFMQSQEVDDELEEGLALLGELVEYAARSERRPLPVSMLKLGLKCGGSDGYSGITGNPLVGAVSDRLIAAGGTAILTEVPEMFGAETILMSRAENEAVFGQIVDLINDFKQYFIRHNQEIYENPSPGNKDGGISTLEEKSLGCTQKGGHAAVVDVVAYGGRATKPGLNLLEAPGNDLVSVTALSAGGAHIVLFTTGRGTPFGGPVPTVKIATNSGLARRKASWIDFDAGRLLADKRMEELADELWEQLIAIASGEAQTKNERHGFKEIAIFKDGVVL